jgi:vacuolar-type H+-ATPase subunit H
MPVPEPDRTVADAIDRVLEAEQATAVAILAAEASARATIEAARETRRQVLERARQRVMRLHERAGTRLAARLAQLDAQSAVDECGAAASADAATGALAAVAERLTTEEPS